MVSHTNLALFNMIEQQIRPAEVLDPKVLGVIAKVLREEFVPENYRALAYSDTAIPLENDAQMMKPIMEARLLQALNIQASDKILQVGTGSGYLTALLATLGRHVVSVDIDAKLSAEAGRLLAKHNITNITLEVGDACEGWDKQAPYDVIALTGSVRQLNPAFKQQLNDNDRLFAVVGRAPVMTALLITRIDKDTWRQESLFETVLPALKNAEPAPQFVF